MYTLQLKIEKINSNGVPYKSECCWQKCRLGSKIFCVKSVPFSQKLRRGIPKSCFAKVSVADKNAVLNTKYKNAVLNTKCLGIKMHPSAKNWRGKFQWAALQKAKKDTKIKKKTMCERRELANGWEVHCRWLRMRKVPKSENAKISQKEKGLQNQQKALM